MLRVHSITHMANHTANLGPRPVLKWMHTWIGLVAGLVIAVVSLTGSVIVFRAEIEQAKTPKGAGGSRMVGLDEMARQVAQIKPGARIRRVRLPARAEDPYIVQIDSAGKQERVVCDASTGKLIGTLEAGWVEWMIDLHRNLLAGKTGRKAVGVTGVILFTLAATGMLLWISGARKWRSWVSVRPQGGTRRFHFELHRAAGLWSYGLLTVLSFTGIGLAYPDTFRSALQSVTGHALASKAPRVGRSNAGLLRPFDEYLRVGAEAMPDGVPTELRLPDGDKGPVDLRFQRSGDLSPSGNHVYLEPSTGRVLAISRAADQPLAARIFSVFAPIHYGEFGGLPVKMIWALLGLTPGLLFVTGLITWWRPRPRQRKQATGLQEDLMLSGSSKIASRER
jgi:uncharacterized iron-regulated membrane protein